MTVENINIHQLLPNSEVNGPGKRFVVWLQGCPLNCPGCFNPLTHGSQGILMKISDLAKQINQTKDIRGLTLSGGEPLFQLDAIKQLIRLTDKRLDILLFSGYSWNEVVNDEAKKQVLQMVDAALLGRYNQKLSHPFRGKKLVLHGGRIKPEELKPWLSTEIVLSDGKVQITGLYKKQGEAK